MLRSLRRYESRVYSALYLALVIALASGTVYLTRDHIHAQQWIAIFCGLTVSAVIGIPVAEFFAIMFHQSVGFSFRKLRSKDALVALSVFLFITSVALAPMAIFIMLAISKLVPGTFQGLAAMFSFPS
jgi:ABC-type sulfate transport system permease subunit